MSRGKYRLPPNTHRVSNQDAELDLSLRSHGGWCPNPEERRAAGWFATNPAGPTF